MNTRLQQFLNAENISQAQLADTLEVARAGVSHILAGRNKPSYDFITSLMLRFPKLNIEWLMFGKGKMYKDQTIAEQPKDDVSLFDDIPQESPLSDVNLHTAENPIDKIKASNDKITLIKTPDKTVNQRNISKIVVFFDDGTFQEF